MLAATPAAFNTQVATSPVSLQGQAGEAALDDLTPLPLRLGGSLNKHYSADDAWNSNSSTHVPRQEHVGPVHGPARPTFSKPSPFEVCRMYGSNPPLKAGSDIETSLLCAVLHV